MSKTSTKSKLSKSSTHNETFTLSDEYMTRMFVTHLKEYAETHLKIKPSIEIQKTILRLLHQRPELRISIRDIFFSDLTDLSHKYTNLMQALIEHVQTQTGGTPRLTIPVDYYERITPYVAIEPWDVHGCNNNFDDCDETTTHPEYCIKRNDTQQSPADPISMDILANSDGMIYKNKTTKYCHDGAMLNNWYGIYNHQSDPVNREVYDIRKKIAVYIDTLVKQQLKKHPLTARFNRLTRMIAQTPLRSVGATSIGVIVMNTVHDILVYGEPLKRVSFSESTYTDHVQGILGLSAIIGVSYYTWYARDIDEGTIPLTRLDTIVRLSTSRSEIFERLPPLPEGDVMEIFEEYGMFDDI
jgi:hypothetical protein